MSTRGNEFDCYFMSGFNPSSFHFHLDRPEQLEVDDGKEGEGNQGHSQEVGDEDVVPRVRQVRAQARWAEPAKNSVYIFTSSSGVAPGYGDQCGVHTPVDADHCHVHHLQESSSGY